MIDRHIEFLRTCARVLVASALAFAVSGCGRMYLAPPLEGRAFAHMRVFDMERGPVGAFVEDYELLDALEGQRLVFFGEQHATAAVQELELWLLRQLTARHKDVTLGMEHFQRDEQPIIDAYLAGSIDTAEFEKKSQPWKGYATYWKPLVEHMKSMGRPVVALNVPDEALRIIYAAHPKRPLEVVNGWDDSFEYAHAIAPRRIGPWDAKYGAYFERDFDYEAHGAKLQMTRDEALRYFTDIAAIRDETMAFFTSRASRAGRMLVIASDWHVQTGRAVPDRIAHYLGTTPYVLITTCPAAKFEETRKKVVLGRELARFMLVYN